MPYENQPTRSQKSLKNREKFHQQQVNNQRLKVDYISNCYATFRLKIHSTLSKPRLNGVNYKKMCIYMEVCGRRRNNPFFLKRLLFILVNVSFHILMIPKSLMV